MKQTAVEWLVERLNLDETSPNYNQWIVEKAKAMEKGQITQSFVGGADFRETNKHHNRSAASYADQYYRTNFKTKIEW